MQPQWQPTDAWLLASSSDILIQLKAGAVCAGFPSPADDYLEEPLDVARLLVTNPLATFIWRVSGTSMQEEAIFDGDFVVVDRSLEPQSGDAVVVVIDSMPSLKRLVRRRGRDVLEMANSDMPPLIVCEDTEAWLWGVVVWVLRRRRVIR